MLQIDLTGMKHVATFPEYSRDEQAAKRQFASARMTDFAMALAAKRYPDGRRKQNIPELLLSDILDDAFEIYEKFSMYA